MDAHTSTTADTKISFLDDRQDNPKSWRQRFKQKLSSSVYREKFYYMLGMYTSSFFAGWVAGLKGPAFLDLQQITGVGTSKGAAFFTAAAVGAAVGNLAGGALYDRYNRHIVLFCSSFLYGVTCAIIPWCSIYWAMVFIFLMHELVTGAARSGTNVEIVEEWGDQGKPFMQALHFSFSIGATVSPFILEPFLSSAKPEEIPSNSNTLLLGISPNVSGSNLNITSSTTPHASDSKIHYAFLIVGILTCLSSFVFLIKHHHDKQRGKGNIRRKDADRKNKKEKSDESEESHRKKGSLPLKLSILTILLIGLFYFFLDEVEDTTPSFLSTFVVKQLSWDKKYGGRLTSAFWASYTTGRGFGIVLVSLVTHIQLFSLCCIVLCLGQVGLLLSGLYQFGTGIWISIVCVGLSLSVIFPASLTWTEKKLVPLSGKLMGIIYGALAAGGLVNPQIIGWTMDMLSPMWFSYVLCAESVLFVITVLALMTFVRKVLSRYSQIHDHNRRRMSKQ